MTALKIFAKLDGDHRLMANIFKLHKYKTFGLTKMHSMSKIWFAIDKFSLWKSLIYNNMLSKTPFLRFLSFLFFQIAIYCQILFEKPIPFYNGFQKFLWSSTTSRLFLICKFLTVKQQPFYNFSKFAQKCILFVYVF